MHPHTNYKIQQKAKQKNQDETLEFFESQSKDESKYQKAKKIISNAMAKRSKKSKMMEEGADYYIKNREGMY